MTNECHCTDLIQLRKLRLWHWRNALKATRRQQDKRASRHTLAEAIKDWSLHMGAVQALNSLFPIGDTAEKDAAKVRVSPNTKAP